MAIAFPTVPDQPLKRGAQATTFAVRLIPDLFDKSLMALDAELNDDIDQEVQEFLDIGARQFLPCATLFHEKHQLLEGECRARGMDAGDGARMAAVDVS